MSLNTYLLNTNDGGANWSNQNSNTTNIMNSIFFPTALTGYACGFGSTFIKTIDGGTNWVATVLPVNGTYMSTFFTSEQTGFIVGAGVGNYPVIMKTTDGGANWVEPSESFVGTLNSVHFPDAQTGYACGTVGLMIKTNNGGLTHIENMNESSPGFKLHQNFPNPFTAETTIHFQLSENSDVELKLYDVNGREVKTLISEKLITGEYSIHFSAKDELVSGVYYYKLILNSESDGKYYTGVRKMIYQQ